MPAIRVRSRALQSAVHSRVISPSNFPLGASPRPYRICGARTSAPVRSAPAPAATVPVPGALLEEEEEEKEEGEAEAAALWRRGRARRGGETRETAHAIALAAQRSRSTAAC